MPMFNQFSSDFTHRSCVVRFLCNGDVQCKTITRCVCWPLCMHSSCQFRFLCDVLRLLVSPQHVSSGAARVARFEDSVEGFDGKIMHASTRRRRIFHSQDSTKGTQRTHNTARDRGWRTRCFRCAGALSQKLHSEHRCFEEAPDFRSNSGNFAT